MGADGIMFFPTITLFLLAVYGISNAIAVLKIGRFFFGTREKRKFLGRIPKVGDLFYCPPCLAFWIGAALSWWWISPASTLMARSWKTPILDGLAASAMVYIIHVAMEKMGYGLDL